MNISYNWLRDLVPTNASPTEVGDALTSVGLAVEGIHVHGEDSVLDIDLTSNRPDCLSHLGVARELSAVLSEKLILPSVTAGSNQSAEDFVAVLEPELCHRFTARIIRNVTVGPSPKWLVERLEAIGERSINNVADITNYVMHELGQPMHAFDLEKLAGERLVVRRALAGETIKTLDGIDRELDSSMLMICDAERPAAVAGIMGGMDSSITEETTAVLIEVAYFDRRSIRGSSRKLNLATEASYRFERGVDIENLVFASERAASLIVELCGGRLGEFSDVYPTRHVPAIVESRDLETAVRRLTGLDVGVTECVALLESLGIQAVGEPQGNSRRFAAPSWRHDLGIEADLVEEVVRHKGLDNIVAQLPPSLGAGEYQPEEELERKLRGVLTSNGVSEAISYSFIDTRYDEAVEFVPGLIGRTEDRFVTLEDSIIEGAVRMRPSALPGLLDAVRLNMNQQRRDLKIFEIGRVFAAADSADGLPAEHKVLALALTGNELEEQRSAPGRAMDFYDLKGVLESALAAAGIADMEVRAAEAKHLKEGQSASIDADGAHVGWLGTLADELSALYKFRQPVLVAEVNLSILFKSASRQVAYQPLAKYPAIHRDISFVVARTSEFGGIRSVISKLGIELCRSVTFVDIYEGKGLQPHERSITVRLEYRSDTRTLVEDEVEQLNQTIVAAVEAGMNATVRLG